jgi:hypothetical protein
MISMYCKDTVTIVRESLDKFGTKTFFETDPLKARVEDYNRTILGQDGKETVADSLILIPFQSSLDIEIQSGDNIKIKKKFGEIYYLPDKMWKIKKFSTVGSFSKQFIEVYI